MVATHDPRLIEITGALAAHHQREATSYEYQMLYGIRPDEQKRIADRGDQMRIYIPYGDEWYGYLMRRMAERPANTVFFLRGLATRG
jgi:proline dehydrogenase